MGMKYNNHLWVRVAPLSVGAHDVRHDVVVAHQDALLRRVYTIRNAPDIKLAGYPALVLGRMPAIR